MKLCPQCEFIYEDDQTLCDMDGRELVYDASAVGCEQPVVPNAQDIHDTYGPGTLDFERTVVCNSQNYYDPSTLDFERTVVYSPQQIQDTYDSTTFASEETVVYSPQDVHDTYDSATFTSEETAAYSPQEVHDTLEIPASPAMQQSSWHFRRTAFASLAAILLVALLFVVYYASTRQPRSSSQASNQTTQYSALFGEVVTAAQAASDSVSAPVDVDSSSVEAVTDSDDLNTSSSSSSSSAPALSRGRVINPVSAGGSGPNNRQQVTVWLANGSSIKADEAWEKKEGVWYRQGGMVTFLKRSSVRSLQREATANTVATKPANQTRKPEIVVAQNHTPANASSHSQIRPGSDNKPVEQNRKPENTIAENRPIAKPELEAAKKESKVSSFLKKTGRILKRPFQF